MEPEEVAREFMEAFNQRDIARMEALCVDEPEIVPIRAALEGTRYRGRDAVRQLIAEVADVWSESRVEIESIERAGDTLLGKAIWRGRGRESGIEVELHVGGRFRIEDGRIVSFETIVDPQDLG